MLNLKLVISGFFLGQLSTDFQFDLHLASSPGDSEALLSVFRYYRGLQRTTGHVKALNNLALATTFALVSFEAVAGRQHPADWLVLVAFLVGVCFFVAVVRPAAETMKATPESASPRFFPTVRPLLGTLFVGHVLLLAIVLLVLGVEMLPL